MRRLICLVLCCVASVSCTLPLAENNTGLMKPATSVSSLFNIRIEQWGQLKFSGLLGLQDRSGGLYYVLLDPTGFKLLEGLLSREGNQGVPPTGGVLKESGVADFLAESLGRVFLMEPSQKPCDRSWLLQLCSEARGETGWLKRARVGPFTIWQTVTNEVNTEKKKSIVYSQSWLGICILLKEINST